MKSLLFFMSLMTPLLFATAFTEEVENRCAAPQHLTVVDQTASSVSYDWSDVFGSTSYKVYYEKNGTSSAVFTTTSSEFTFDNLTSGSYQFYFFTECDAGQYSIIVEEHLDM